jgi:hypothetical protein
MMVFWDVTLSSFVDMYVGTYLPNYISEDCYLHIHYRDIFRSQKETVELNVDFSEMFTSIIK